MPPRPALDVVDVAGGRHDIEQVDDRQRGRHPERRVVHARSLAVGKGNIVDPALAVQPRGPERAGFLIFGVLRRPEAKVVIESHALVDVGGEDVEMVDAQRPNPAIERVLLRDVRQSLHVAVELDRHPMVIAQPQRPSLKRPLDPAGFDALGFEVVLRPVEVRIVPDLVGCVAHARRLTAGEDHAVVPALFHGTQKYLV